MNCISKAILLSAVGLCVDSGNLTYASTQIPLSIPKKSGISTLHIHHTYASHTIQRLNLSSRLFDDLGISGEEQKVASVCFITDTHKCSVDKFDNTDEPENGNGAPGSGSGNDETPETPEYKTPEEVCQDAGYGQTPCPEGSSPIPCPVRLRIMGLENLVAENTKNVKKTLTVLAKKKTEIMLQVVRVVGR